MKLSKTDMINYSAILVIVVSLASIGMQLTGFATTTDTAVVNVTIDTSAAINFTVDFVDFGSGAVTNGTIGALLDTESTADNGTWTPTATGFTLENIGNVNVTLGFYADKNASTYLGGSSPTFKFKVTDVEANSCQNPSAATYTEFLTTNITACSPLMFDDANDTIDLDIELFIPSDSFTGEQTATITATGEY